MSILFTILVSILEIVGSLSIFLYGMKMLGDGLQRVTGSKMKKILEMMTGNRIKAVITGVLVTAIIQSSSATTVMVVSFVNASLLSLTQAIGVIFGANIGTTVTGWIVAILGFKFSIEAIAIPIIGIGFPLLFAKKIKLRFYGDILIGFGLLFLGLSLLQNALPDLQKSEKLLSLIRYLKDPSFFIIIACVFAGTIFTVIVQSSSATMAIILTMAFRGWLGPISASAMVLGQNIGTTITAYLASIGTNTNAKRAAWAHILFNVIGTIIALIFFNPLIRFVNYITLTNIFTITPDLMYLELPAFLAMFHTIFNLLNTLLFLPFVNSYAKLIEKIVKPNKSDNDKNYHFDRIASSYHDAPEVYILSLQEEMEKLGKLSIFMLQRYIDTFFDKKVDIRDVVAELKERETYADQMQSQLSEFIVKLMQDNTINTTQLSNCLRVIDELESITDSAYNLICMSERYRSEEILFEEYDINTLASYNSKVLSFLEETVKMLQNGCTYNQLKDSQEREAEIDKLRYDFNDRIKAKLIEGNAQVKAELLLLELVRHLEHIGDYCLNIAESIHSGYKKIKFGIEKND